MLRSVSIIFVLAVGLAACCEPGHKDSTPYVVNSMFQETYGRDIDFYNQSMSNSSIPDSAYFPIYTFAIQNTGTSDDIYTLQLRNQRLYGSGGFDITKRVPAGKVVLFKTPLPIRDSVMTSATYAFESTYALQTGDTAPNLDIMYYALSFQTTDSAEIHNLRPSLQIVYGAIDNGPEGCNTPASTMQVNIDSLPVR